MSVVLVSSADHSIMIPKEIIKSFEIISICSQYYIVVKTRNDETFTMGRYSDREDAIKKLEQLVCLCYEVVAFEEEKRQCD